MRRASVLAFNCFLFLLLGIAAPAFAETITFDSLIGPSTFAAAGNAQTLNISTSIGTVTISGGVILTNATNLPADETSIYGTAGNAANIGVTTGTGFTNPITITFPVPIQNFVLDVLNGNVQDVTYEVADNNGNTNTTTLAPNLSSGLESIGFAATGTVVTIAALTGQSTSSGMTWDFFIDNLTFDEPLSTPEPGSASLVFAGLGAMIATRRFVFRKVRGSYSYR